MHSVKNDSMISKSSLNEYFQLKREQFS